MSCAGQSCGAREGIGTSGIVWLTYSSSIAQVSDVESQADLKGNMDNLTFSISMQLLEVTQI